MTPANHSDKREVFRRQIGPALAIKLLEPADAETIFPMIDRDRGYLAEWLPWVERTRSAADVRQFITDIVTPQWLDNRGPQCGIWMEEAFAGTIGCHPIDWRNRNCSLGYWIASQYQGRGIVTTAVAAMLDYLFFDLDLHRVVIQCGTGNHRSCAIPQRLAFTREGIAREAELVNNRWIDLVVWSILHTEWTAGGYGRAGTY